MANPEKDIHPVVGGAPGAPLTSPDIQIKHHDDIDLVEKVDRDALPEDTIMKSPFEDLGIRQTWSTFRKCALMCLFATFSAAADGYQIALTGNIIAFQGFIRQYGEGINPTTGAVILRADHLAAWGGIQSAGQGFAMLSQHFIADKYGRKMSFYILWLSLLIAVFLQAFGTNWRTWLVAKLFSGFGVGSVQFMTGMYISELCPARIRGFLLIGYSFWYGFGQLCSSLALKVMSDRDPSNFKVPIYTEFVTIGIMAIVYYIIPESPYWCAAAGKHDKGVEVIRFLNGGIEGYDVQYHYDIIRRSVEKEVAYQKQKFGEGKGFLQELANVKEVLTGVNGFRTLIAFWPAFLQQLAGLAVLSSYSSYFAQIAGFADPFLFSLLLALVALACTVIEASLIDVIGRRNLFLGGAVGCWAMCFVVGCMSLPTSRSSAVNSLTLFFSLMWRVGSTLLGNLGWSYVAETGSSRLRAKTAGIAAAGGVCMGLIFNTTVPYMLNPIGANWGLKLDAPLIIGILPIPLSMIVIARTSTDADIQTAFFFSGISAPLVIASFFLIPDTSRRTPAELDEMFRKKVRPWRFRSYVTDAKKALDAERARTGEVEPSRLQANQGVEMRK